MDETELQPVRASMVEVELTALRFNWDEAYEIGWDEERGYHARRLDGLGGNLTASGPDELRKTIWDDYTLKPVPRDLPARLAEP